MTGNLNLIAGTIISGAAAAVRYYLLPSVLGKRPFPNGFVVGGPAPMVTPALGAAIGAFTIILKTFVESRLPYHNSLGLDIIAVRDLTSSAIAGTVIFVGLKALGLASNPAAGVLIGLTLTTDIFLKIFVIKGDEQAFSIKDKTN